MTDNATAAQRLRRVATFGILTAQEDADLLAVLDEHAALLAAEPRPAFVVASDAVISEDDFEKIRTEIREGKFPLRKRTLSGRLSHIADGLYIAAEQIQTTHPDLWTTFIGHIVALRVEVDQARAVEQPRSLR